MNDELVDNIIDEMRECYELKKIQRGISMKKIADKIGVNKKTIYRIFNHEYKWDSLLTLCNIADQLGLEITVMEK